MYTSLISKTCITAAVGILLCSCGTQGPAGLFGKKTAHEQYGDRIIQAGLRETAMGQQWFEAADKSLANPNPVTLPYSETGYFAAERPSAVGLKFIAKRGQLLNITLNKKPVSGFAVYFELWAPAQQPGNKPKLLSAADTASNAIRYEIKDDGDYYIRIQPELLKSGEYTISLTTGPSLAYPFQPKAKAAIASFWGAARDRGARKHEGIDIMAPFRTPCLATANGTISRVNENKLGGKTVWLRPSGKDYVVYYAHLDEQLVTDGQQVTVGDTIGLVGTTGNARGGAPHLHLGIYTNAGAVDPLAFIDPVVKTPAKIVAAEEVVGKLVRTNARGSKIYAEPGTAMPALLSPEVNTILRAEAATANWYRVVLPGGTTGYINHNHVDTLRNPVRSGTTPDPIALLESPTPDAPRKLIIEKGRQIKVLGTSGNYYFVEVASQNGWLNKATL
ncbi:M23 family metallopeptidase [Segetibacter sp. 3557_3]|uniref:M23 family metallopeptidase n=1 Tax=Segetibacter sp. 3557_3 TaxID=2547429 RepID=UPI001404D02C|nr:M23 family metallopeptidase [Segetibacter sp. 3557_3]